jgi:hypothetical protein
MKLQAIAVHSMRRVVIGTIAVALVALAIQLSTEAADNPNTSWYQVVSFRFKPGKTTEALQIIHEHFPRGPKSDRTKGDAFRLEGGDGVGCVQLTGRLLSSSWT